MNTLDKMGIQQWRLKARVVRDEPAPTAAPVEVGVEQADSSSSMLPPSTPHQADGNRDPAPEMVPAEKLANQGLGDSPGKPGLDEASWSDLVDLLQGGGSCPSCEQSTPVLGDGNLEAEWVFVVDAPRARDIKNQQLVSGREGQLFDAILNAAGMTREMVYLTSVFKCPPTDNVSVSAQCDGIVHRQLALIKPKVVLAFGEFSAQTLLRTNDSLDLMRGQDHVHQQSSAPTVVSYSPSQLLEQPALKAQVWKDLQQCMSLL
ncbi:MAG: uracil-DNA glycosylase [Pseudomonadota bacterium]